MNTNTRRFAALAGGVALATSAVVAYYLRNKASEGKSRDMPGAFAEPFGAAKPAGSDNKKKFSQEPLREPQLSREDRIKAFRLLSVVKQQANVAFQEGRYQDAVRGYQDCISVTSTLGAQDAEGVLVEQVIRSNVVMAFIKQQLYDEARLVATALLQDSENPLTGDLRVKVLYRRGLASKALGETDSAVADFKAAVHFSPNQSNPVAEREIALLLS